MITSQNSDVFRQVIDEGFNKGNFDAWDVLFAPDYQEHQFGLSKTLEGVKGDVKSLRAAFPDLHLTIDDMAADGDKLWVRMTARGTNLGPMFGPPTGRPMAITVYDSCRFEDGKIVEHWGVPDRFAQMAQLGLLPIREESPPQS